MTFERNCKRPHANTYSHNETSFYFTLPDPTTTVIVLSQLDTRYFSGLTGQYKYSLSFHLQTSDRKFHIARGYSSGDRSATTELFLEAGTYRISLQITGYRDTTLPDIEDVVKQNWLDRRDKLIQIGLKHDMAYVKGMIKDDLPKKEKMSSAPVAVASFLTPPATPPVTPVIPTNDVPTTYTKNKDAWNASCVVGLKIYTYQTIAKIGIGKVEDETKIEIVGVEREKEGQGIRKLISNIDEKFSCSLRRIKIKTRKKSLRIKWRFNDMGWMEEMRLSDGGERSEGRGKASRRGVKGARKIKKWERKMKRKEIKRENRREGRR